MKFILESYLLTHYVPKENVIKSRILLFLLGWGCTSGMLNYDATVIYHLTIDI